MLRRSVHDVSRVLACAATVALCLTVLSGAARAQDYGFEPRFEIGGYLSTQVGLFISPYEAKEAMDKKAKRVFPVDHGDRLGELSMFRNTLFVEVDWQPFEPVSLHAIFRGVRSLTVPSDYRDGDPPIPGDVTDVGDWVRDNYYSETDIRELYLTINAADWWSMRIGKQQISWGELGQYRLLDVVNPTNTTWHFGPVESFEDTRIPLWMFEALFEVRPLKGALELIWIPLIDEDADQTNVPLTFPGAWGLPRAPAQENKSIASEKILGKVFHAPGGSLDDGRVGARWKGEIGDITYSLAYMYTHQLSPPIPRYHVAYWGAPGVEVHLEYPRQHIIGGSLEIPFESPLGMIARIEVAYEPNREFPQYSLATGPNEVFLEPSVVSNEVNAVDAFTPFHWQDKQVLTYGIQLFRPTMIRALNPTQNFIIVLQFMHSMILDYDGKEKLLDVPGFDTTPSKMHTYTLVGVVTTTYLNGLIRPMLIGAYLPPRDLDNPRHNGFLSAQVRLTLGNHWRIQAALNMFWGDDPYSSVGFFRDRDEVNLKITYQF